MLADEYSVEEGSGGGDHGGSGSVGGHVAVVDNASDGDVGVIVDLSGVLRVSLNDGSGNEGDEDSLEHFSFSFNNLVTAFL